MQIRSFLGGYSDIINGARKSHQMIFDRRKKRHRIVENTFEKEMDVWRITV